jgi:hypothetical protein
MLKKQDWENGFELHPKFYCSTCKYLSAFSINIRRKARNKKQDRCILQVLHKHITEPN